MTVEGEFACWLVQSFLIPLILILLSFLELHEPMMMLCRIVSCGRKSSLLCFPQSSSSSRESREKRIIKGLLLGPDISSISKVTYNSGRRGESIRRKRFTCSRTFLPVLRFKAHQEFRDRHYVVLCMHFSSSLPSSCLQFLLMMEKWGRKKRTANSFGRREIICYLLSNTPFSWLTKIRRRSTRAWVLYSFSFQNRSCLPFCLFFLILLEFEACESVHLRQQDFQNALLISHSSWIIEWIRRE